MPVTAESWRSSPVTVKVPPLIVIPMTGSTVVELSSVLMIRLPLAGSVLPANGMGTLDIVSAKLPATPPAKVAVLLIWKVAAARSVTAPLNMKLLPIKATEPAAAGIVTALLMASAAPVALFRMPELNVNGPAAGRCRRRLPSRCPGSRR